MDRAYRHGFLMKGLELSAQGRNLAADPRELKSIVHCFAPIDLSAILPTADYEPKFAVSVACHSGEGSPIMRGSRSKVGFFLITSVGAACGAAHLPAATAAQPTAVVSGAASSTARTQPVALSHGRRSISPDPDAGPSSDSPPKALPRAAGSVPSHKKQVQPPAKEAACPEGMQLMNGDYCTEVKHQCLESWYDKSNKKTVCERFEPKSSCVGERKHKRFCIDRYEWPNRAGERPEVMNRFHQAEVKCAALGKRLCTESEWTMTCEGPKFLPFPYGYVRDTNICHGDVMWDSPDMKKVAARDPAELARLWKGVRSGSQPQCVSEYGVYDMPGNADEVVSSETYSSDFRGKFDSVHTGGPWYKGVRNQCRPKIYTHDEGFYYYFLSFRCCAEPDRQDTDPRTAKQRKANWKFEKVEQIAGFSRLEVQKALRTKAEKGNCGCGKGDIRCNTLCGTLLGAQAKDFPKTRR